MVKYLQQLQIILSEAKSRKLKEQAFFIISDLLVVFNQSLRLPFSSDDLPLSDLVPFITKYLDDSMSSFGNQDNQGKIGKRQSMVLAAYARLVAYNAFPGDYKEYVPRILLHFAVTTFQSCFILF